MRDLGTGFFWGGGGFRGRGGLCRCRLFVCVCIYIYNTLVRMREEGEFRIHPRFPISSRLFFFLSRVFNTISILGAAFCKPPYPQPGGSCKVQVGIGFSLTVVLTMYIYCGLWIFAPGGNGSGGDEGEGVGKRRGLSCVFVLGEEVGRLSCGAGFLVVRALEKGGAVGF